MIKILTVSSLTIGIICQANAAVIAQWNFDSLTLPTTAGTSIPTPTNGSLAADVGSGVVSGSHASSSTVWSTPAGNGSSKSLSSNNWAIGDYYQFQVSTTGFSDIYLGWMQTGSNTGPANFKLEYSTDGVAFTNFANYSVPTVVANTSLGWNTSSYAAASTIYYNLSGVAALNDASAVYFRLTVASAGSINGTNIAAGGTGRVDSFTVSDSFVDIAPIPEPGTLALVGLGVAVAMSGLRRRN